MADPRHQLLIRCKTVALAVALAWGGLVPVVAVRAQMPGGGKVVVPGSATIDTRDPTRYVVTQSGNKAIINWDSFSVGAGNSVRFVQSGRDAVVLNRVVGNDVSRIFGSISANGQVFLVNPNGIYFAPGATLDVGGLVATTLGIRDKDFLAGNYVFTRGDSAARAEVVNAGVLKARDNGYVVLAGDYAANRGVIEARLGTVMLGSASKMTLDVDGDSLINYALNERNLTELAGVANSGELLADGGRVVMTAMTARSLTGAVVNNTGVIQARGVEEKAGAVYLLADDAGIALGSGSKIDVSGAKGGGTVLVGGNYQGSGGEVHASTVSMAADASIKADATQNGDGGKVVLWSDGVTDFKGTISARGGSQGGDGGDVEVSGKQLAYAGTVDTRAPEGKTGSLLLDPANITISNDPDSDVTAGTPFGDATDNGGTSNLNVTTLQNALASSNVTVTTATTAGSDAGNITVKDAVTWSSSNMLSLIAANQILINATVSGTSGTLVLNAGGGATQSAAIQVGNLALKGSGTFTLNNSGNAVDTLAASVNGAVNFRTSGALSVGSVDGVNGVSLSGKAFTLTVGGALSQTQALNVGSLELNSSTGTVDLSNASNSIGSVAAQTHGDFTLKNTSANLYIQTLGSTTGVNTDNHNFTLINTNTLWLGNGSSNGTVDVGSGTIDLTSNRELQYGSAPLKADKLVVRTTNYAGLSGVANSVNTLAVSATGTGGGSSSQSF
ncbi:MAG TPA: filamentous hemagglutinin N-terminal domain-containing protein, partial [Rhodocyclaceae bacterium]|nr:filamentous hemagglutinin N-terminal domain-containing protein [Rhodocyclaceae bacterium]